MVALRHVSSRSPAWTKGSSDAPPGMISTAPSSLISASEVSSALPTMVQ